MTARPSREVTLAVQYVQRTGCTITEAARKYGVAARSVRRALRRAGVPPATAGRPRKPAPPVKLAPLRDA